MCARVLVVPKVVVSKAPALLLTAVLALAMTPPAAAWLPSPNSVAAASVAASPGPGHPGPTPVALDSSVPLAWPVASIAPPAEGCLSPALGVVKVLAVVLGALAALKLPLVLAKVLLAKVLLLLPLALPLALPLLVPFMFMAAMLPLPGFGMDDSPASDAAGPAPASPALPPAGGAAAGGGNASPVSPSGEEMEARGVWVERCVQRVACQLSTRGSRKECSRFHCAAIDWLGGT